MSSHSSQPPFTQLKSRLRCSVVIVSLWLCACLLCPASLPAQQWLAERADPANVDSAKDVLSSRNFPWYDSEADGIRPITFPPRPPAAAGDRDQIPDAPPQTPSAANPFSRGGTRAAATGFSAIAWIGLVLIIAALIALLLWAFFRLESQSRTSSEKTNRRSLADSIKHLPFSVDQPNGDLLSAARTAYQSGDYRNAIIYLYSHLLVSLDEHDLIRLQRGRTNRQYLRDLKVHPSVSRYFDSVMQPFEAVFFGDHTLSKSEFETPWNQLDTFLAEVEQLRISRQSNLTSGPSGSQPLTQTIAANAVASTLLLSIGLLTIGCSRPTGELNTDYGKVTSSRGNSSVNGTSVLAGMFEKNGYRVKRLNRISPRLNKYQTIIWFPDDFAPPSSEAIEALEEWLNEGNGRKLFYVGRDFDAATKYLQDLGDAEVSQQPEETRRRLAEAKLRHDQQSLRNRFSNSDSCRWFEIAETGRQRVKNLSGYWSEKVAANQTEIERSTLLKPPKSWFSDNYSEATPLLKADGHDFVWSANFSSDWRSESELVVISNGSFLLNYGLVNRENRKLAGALIEYCNSASEIVFLDSGPEGIPISKSDKPNRNAWAWIAQPPLSYIVPHFLMWSVLFCFVFFPIFGRPKKWLPKRSASGKPMPHREQSSFRNHIVAMGKLLQRGNHFDEALTTIKQYKEKHLPKP